MPTPVPPTRRVARPPRRVAPLRSADRLSLPVGQKVVAPAGTREGVVEAISTVVVAGGFTLVASPLKTPPDSGASAVGGTASTLIAERKVRRVATSYSMRVSIAVLLGAGVGLGALDTVIAGSVIDAAPWVGIAGLGAFLLWLRYGRTYESEVIAVSLLPPTSGRPGETAGASLESEVDVMWSAGRIRSVAFSGVRAAVEVVDCPVSLMDALVRLVHGFQTEPS